MGTGGDGSAGKCESIKVVFKKGFLNTTDKQGNVQRIIREEGGGKTKVKCRRLCINCEDITTVAVKAEEDDITMTLVNGSEFNLNDFEDRDVLKQVYKQLCKKVYEAAEDEDEDSGSGGDD